MATARWRVTNQVQRDDLTRDGFFVTVVEVSYEVLDTGTRGKVVVPLNQYTVERVAEEIQSKADAFMAVGKLGNP